jgi:tRNA-splicing ligase RtcB
MPPKDESEKLLNWASEIDQNALQQAHRASRLPFIAGHVALMPDAHWGMGATVGSVSPTEGAVIPAAVGVDIGCGMCAVETTLAARDLPGSLEGYMKHVQRDIPAGVGRGHSELSEAAEAWLAANPPETDLAARKVQKAGQQFGSLGSGNHFFEVCLDERDVVWLVLHSGSRGVGNELASHHIDIAKGLMKQWVIQLEDPDLAYLVQNTPEFDAYIRDMLWSQRYARANRDQMMNTALRSFFRWAGHGAELTRVNCHHNFTEQEQHHGRTMWLTRKGAIRAGLGDLGVIPGSMGTRSYIVRGLGSPASYESSSHGAGRKMGRGQAMRSFTGSDLRKAMGDRVWLDADADQLVDEAPMAYKDIDQVMEDQRDLVEVVHTLRQLLNYKGVEERRGKRRGR